MRYFKILSVILAIFLILTAVFCMGCWLYLNKTDGYFARNITEPERDLRLNIVHTAKSWLDTLEGDDSHREIIEIYNTHEPLAQGYALKPEDNWCAAFASCVAIQCHRTDIIPTECGCERQIRLWQHMDRWEENDNYLPLPGDYIYYAWDEAFTFGDCTGWADHVGIVVGTAGPFIKVIEGNKDDSVTYRIIFRADPQIRGYGLPAYSVG